MKPNLLIASVLLAWPITPAFGQADGAAAGNTSAPAEARAKAVQLHEKALLVFAVNHDRAAAQAAFAESAQADPTYVPPRRNLARLAEAANDWDGAIRWETEIRGLSSPADAELASKEMARLEAAKVRWATPDGQKQMLYEQAMRRAQMLWSQDDIDGTAREAEAATKIDSSHFEAWSLRAHAAAVQTKFPAAIEYLEKARQVAPKEFLSDIETAMGEVRTLIDFTSALDHANQKLADKAYAEAAQLFQSAFALRPDRGDTGLMAAAALVLDNRATAAIPVLEAVIRTGDMSQRSEAIKQLAAIKGLGDQGVLKEARQRQDEEAQATFSAQGSIAANVEKEMETKANDKATLEKMRKLAAAYRLGQGVEANEATAAYWLRQAADRGDAESAFTLGLAYRGGKGVAKSPADSFKWLNAAAESGWVGAMPEVADAYDQGIGTGRDGAKAVDWWHKAYLAGNPDAAYHIAVIYGEGRDVAQNEQVAASWYYEATKAGNAKAMLELGNLGYKKQNLHEAVTWWDKAADGSEWTKESMHVMAATFMQGTNGFSQNLAKAYRYYYIAATENDKSSELPAAIGMHLGYFRSNDTYVMADWFRQAAEQGDGGAMYYLGNCYENGTGLEQDYQKAAYWYEQASNRNVTQAMMGLGHLYDEGEGVPKDRRKGSALLEQAADAGDASAMGYIGMRYLNGAGVEKNKEMALYYLRKAAEHGDEAAATVVRRFGP